ncbi:MAG: ABC transporter ATP-binding protein [Deltaproteobacteria bacterium]|nr:ABC transporter ATP-binding protein [Deltaproteobacteria bacterium]
MLELENVEITYNDVILAVKGVSLRVPKGSIVALLGANGAGKSTVLKAISGILGTEEGRIERGQISFEGRRIDALGPAALVREGVLHVPEGRRVFSDLTTYDNLKVGAYTNPDRGAFKNSVERVLEYFPVLGDRLDVRAGFLSGGEQQMLAIGRALMGRPRLLMLDEPSLGLAPLVVRSIFEIIRRINEEESIDVLLVEQNANIALSVASHGYIMENGRIVMDDASEKLLKNQDVQEFYLGVTEEGGKKSFADVKHYKRRKRWLS